MTLGNKKKDNTEIKLIIFDVDGPLASIHPCRDALLDYYRFLFQSPEFSWEQYQEILEDNFFVGCEKVKEKYGLIERVKMNEQKQKEHDALFLATINARLKTGVYPGMFKVIQKLSGQSDVILGMNTSASLKRLRASLGGEMIDMFDYMGIGVYQEDGEVDTFHNVSVLQHKRKGDKFQWMMNESDISDKNQVYWITDSIGDIKAGKAFGLPIENIIAVSWGVHTKEQVKEYDENVVISDKTEEVIDILRY